MAVMVCTEWSGMWLVAQVGPEERRPFWRTWKIDGDDVRGPESLGNWINFVPSDWHVADPALSRGRPGGD